MAVKSFKEYAKEKDLTQDYYPRYRLTSIASVLKTINLSLAIIAFILKTGIKIANDKGLLQMLDKVQLDSDTLVKIIYIISTSFTTFLILTIISIILKQVSYVLRSKAYERDARANDKESNKLRNKLIKMTGLNGKISRARSNMRNSNGGVDYNKEVEAKAYEAIKKMDVMIHTRESLDDPTIKKSYTIKIGLPNEVDVENKIISELKDFNVIATKACGGLIQFGQYTLSADRSSIIYNEEIIVPDKYEVVEETEVKEEIDYESVFSKSLFIDRSKERASKLEAANNWGQNIAKSLDRILATLGVQATRKQVTVGASNVLVVYQLSFNLSMNHIQSLGEQLDNVLRTTGSAAFLDAGDLKISIPTPKSLTLPIDVPSMYTEIFG